MITVVLVIHLIVAILLIGIVLMQKSEGGALGIGGSNSGNLFSARGVGNALTRTTALLAVAFFITSISLTLLARHLGTSNTSIFAPAAGTANPEAPAGKTAPATPPQALAPATTNGAAPAQPAPPSQLPVTP